LSTIFHFATLFSVRFYSSAYILSSFSSTRFMADRTEARRNLEESEEIRISRTLASHSVFSRERDLPGWSKVAINELHRHLTINDLDDVHRGAAGRIAAALCTDDEFTARAISDVRATYAIKALCLHVRVRACVSIARERVGKQKGGNRERERERERERGTFGSKETDIRCSATTIALQCHAARILRQLAVFRYSADCFIRIELVK